MTSVSALTQRYTPAIVDHVPGSGGGVCGRYESAGSGGMKNMSRGKLDSSCD